jgi:hypothetical protein
MEAVALLLTGVHSEIQNLEEIFNFLNILNMLFAIFEPGRSSTGKNPVPSPNVGKRRPPCVCAGKFLIGDS